MSARFSEFGRRRHAAAACTAAVLALAGGAAHGADAYPNRPVKIVVPYTPGTAADTFARMISEPLAQRLGQSVVVENKPGAAAAIGTNYVARSTPDGYTLMMSMNTHVITPASRKTPYDPVADFSPIGQIAYGQLMIVTHPSTPANSFPELVAYLKKQGDNASYGSPGIGSTTHLYSIVLQDTLGTNMRHIPANGMATAVMDAMQNNSTILITGPDSAGPLIASGKLKALALTGARHMESLNLPTVADSGYPGFDLSIYVGLYAPAGTPKAIIDRLNKDLTAVVETPQIRASTREKGYEVVTSTPEAFAELNKKEYLRWKKVVHDHGLQVVD